MVRRRLLELFGCPRCGEALAPKDTSEPSSGVLCPRRAPVSDRRGYLDLLGEAAPDDTTARTFESFGYEWNTFDDVRDEDAQFAEVYFRDLDMASLHGKVGLDAGCGKGRYTRFLAPHLDALVALDGSSAVEAAARNLAPFPTSSWSGPTCAPPRAPRNRRPGRLPRGAPPSRGPPSRVRDRWCGCWPPTGGSSCTSTAGRPGFGRAPRGPGRLRRVALGDGAHPAPAAAPR